MKKERVTYIKATVNILSAVAALLLCIWLLPKFIVFFIPFIIGWIISLMAAPLVKFFEEKLKIRRKAGTVFVIVLVLAIVILIVYAIGYVAMQEIARFVGDLPELWASVGSELNMAGNNLMKYIDRLPTDLRDNIYTAADVVKKYFNDAFSGDINSGGAITTVGNIVNSIPDVIMGVVMALLSSYFFVAEKEYMNDMSEKHIPGAIRYRWDMIKRSIKSAFGGYFKAQFKIEIWVYLITLVGLLILRTRYAILIALGIAFLDFLPVFGAGAVMIPWAAVKLFSGEYGVAIGLLLVWGIGQIIRQLIQPKIVGDSIGVKPIPTLFLLYIGFKFGGVFGMIIAVPIGIIVINMYEEGVLSTTIESFRILFAGFNRFRKIRPDDIAIIEAYQNELPQDYRDGASTPGIGEEAQSDEICESEEEIK